MIPDVLMYAFALVGALTVVLIISVILFDRTGGDEVPTSIYKSGWDEAFEYLDNEVRGTMRYEEPIVRGRQPIEEATLKGRVDMIEKHLGIKVEVEPAKDSKLKVVKEKKR